MKKRNKLLFLGVLLASVSLAACSSSTNVKGKGIAQLMHDDKERVFYEVHDFNQDSLPGKDETVERICISKKGKVKIYTFVNVGLKMDDVAGKDINEIKKLAEEKAKETYEIENVNAVVKTDSSGNNTTSEEISLQDGTLGKYTDFVSLTNGQIRDKYYSGYIEYNHSLVSGADMLITEVPKGNSISFDKADGKIVTEKKSTN